MSDNPFVLPANEYRRNLNVLKTYVEDSSKYLSIMTGRPIEECTEFIRKQLRPGGEFAFKDPDIIYTEREENGDRVKKMGKLSIYINDAIKNKELIAPTLTTYLNPNQKKSLLVDFIDANIKARSTAKKAMFVAKVAGNKTLATLKDIEQTNKKTSNNSLSGAHVSASTPLYNKTAHSTLTSNCRSTSGYGNANNEKFLCGNRHYWSPDIVRNNIISIINHSDYTAIDHAMGEFGIRYPTVQETMDCIKYSTNLYWKTRSEHTRIEALVNKLTDIERAAFVYTGDLYHLMKFNDDVVRRFISKLSTKVEIEHPDPKTIIDKANDDIKSLVNQIFSEEMKGKSIKDVVNTPIYSYLASTIENVNNVVNEYRNLIRAFWVTENVPASLGFFPDSIRRAVVTSDTDSTIFTVQDWVVWYQGKLVFNTVSTAIAATVIYLASQTITHILAKMSANFGIEQKRLFQIAMKNEFSFPVFVPTGVAKHYFASISCREGNVYNEHETEIKGVHLKSSNAPKVINEEAKKMMNYILDTIADNKKISLNFIMKWIADIERRVVTSLKSGSHEYYRSGQVKAPSSYVEAEAANPYQQYLLWEEVFASKYGHASMPPYSSIKVGVDINTPTKTKEWLMAIQDREIATRLEQWLTNKKAKNFGGTFMLPEEIVASKGIPEEIASVIGIRKILIDTTGIFYLILETLNIYMLNDRMTRLCIDTH